MEYASTEFPKIYPIEFATPNVLSVNKGVDTKIICSKITETSTTYNVITLFDGKCTLLIPCNTPDNNIELKTYVEVKPMSNEIRNKLDRIYSTTIIISIFLIILSCIALVLNTLSIPSEVFYATATCSTIGLVSFIFEKYNFKRREVNYGKKAR